MKIPIQWFKERLKTGSSKAAAADVYPHHRTWGIGQDWSPTTYGNYYAASVHIYAAIRIRADALSQAPLNVFRIESDGSRTRVPPTHPLQRLLDSPSQWFTGRELSKATETFLCLWGKAYWSIEVVEGRQELWPIRPDRLIPLPGVGREYVKGYLYRGAAEEVAYLPEEIIAFHNFNPFQDRAGLSPIAPMRLTADMSLDAIKYNRQTFRNGGIPDYILFAQPELTDQQVQAFYERWERRFTGPEKSHRPAIVSGIIDMKPLAFSQREMEFIEGLHWTKEEAATVFGVPQPFLGSLREATLANVESLERIFWRNTMVPEAHLVEDKINQNGILKLGWEGYEVSADLSAIEALTEVEETRLRRESAYLDRGVLTVNEVRRGRGWQPLPGGDDPDIVARRLRRPTAGSRT